MGQTDGQTLYHYMDAGSPLEAGSIVCFCLHVMHYSCMTACCSVYSHTAVHKAQCRLVGWLARVVFHTALIVCVAGSVKLLNVCLSLCLFICPVSQHAAVADLLLWARQPRDIDRLLHGRCSATKSEQCHVVC